MSDVFISYSWEEKAQAYEVMKKLEKAGITCWMDQEKTYAGDSFPEVLSAAIKECSFLVFILSEKAQNSKWTMREILFADNIDKKIISFIIEDCQIQDKFQFVLGSLVRYLAYQDMDGSIQKMIAQISDDLSKPYVSTKQYDFGTYTGEFVHEKRHGKGKFTWTSEERNGNTYEGEWKDDVRCGQGVYRWSDNAIYVGEWVNDLRNGRGALQGAYGDMYVGEFKDGNPNGYGNTRSKSGNIYTGNFVNGIFEGNGTMIYQDGRVYIGEWKDGKRHGKGELTYPDGTKQSGQWKNHKFIG